MATAWCRTRHRAVRIDLDEARDLIVAGRADPQLLTPLQADQYETSIRACVALARVFLADGYDMALEAVFEPDDFNQRWRPLLAGLAWHLVVLRPSLSITLARCDLSQKGLGIAQLLVYAPLRPCGSSSSLPAERRRSASRRSSRVRKTTARSA